MAEETTYRILKVARELNIGFERAIEYLSTKGEKVEKNPNAKLNEAQYRIILKEFGGDTSIADKQEAKHIKIGTAREAEQHSGGNGQGRLMHDDAPRHRHDAPSQPSDRVQIDKPKLAGTTVLGKVQLDSKGNVVQPKPAAPAPPPAPSAPAPRYTPPPATPSAPRTMAQEGAANRPVASMVASAPVAKAPETAAPAPKPAAEATTTQAALQPTVQPNLQPAQQQESKPATLAEREPKAEKAPETKQEQKQDQKQEQQTTIKASQKPNDTRPARADQKSATAKPATAQPALQPAAQAPVAPPIAGPDSGPAPDAPTEVIRAEADQLKGLTVLGKIALPVDRPRGGKGRPGAPGAGGSAADKQKRERKRIKAVTVGPNAGLSTQSTGGGAPGQGNRPGGGYQGNRPGGGYQGNRPNNGQGGAPGAPGAPGTGAPGAPRTGTGYQGNRPGGPNRPGGGYQGNRPPMGGANRSKYRRDKRSAMADARSERDRLEQEDANILRVAEFISANDLATLMDVSVNDVIAKAMGMGMFVSINQRLDAESITILADEFDFDVQFTSVDEEEDVKLKVDEDIDLSTRAPIVTIMGHVDHGKTSLLDFIRKSKVASGEAGGITQHIGAYNVKTSSGKQVTFLDTPGHEAFTAMRARGAKVTDIVIIVIAADDSVMPQTREAINHAQVAQVPMVFAFNKIDKPGADSEKIRQELSSMNILVEEWGGKYQTQEISAKSGLGIDELLEKVLLEAEMLDLKANPDREASGTVIEASLDKGRGYLATMLIQNGTLKVGDIVLAGPHFGRVRAMLDHRGERVKTAGPSAPVQVLGLAGAPQAGDKFNVMETEREAREIANKREQIQREQSLRTRKHITLDEIGRRLAIGTFKELNVIVKGDVDGSVEALSDSLQRLSTPEVQVNILQKGVGAISETDVLLASASDAIIVGFQVRPSGNAKKLAEAEEIEIRYYSIIYDAINELKTAMEGLLAPTIEETITGLISIREVYKISKLGNIAGCMVTEGFVKRGSMVRLLRENIVIHTGKLSSLKRFKDDVAEVKTNYECGLTVDNFNDIQIDDILEAYETKEVKRFLA